MCLHRGNSIPQRILPDHPNMPSECLLRWSSVRLQLWLPAFEWKMRHCQRCCAFMPCQLLLQRSFMHLQLRILSILHRRLRILPSRHQLGRLSMLILFLMFHRLHLQHRQQPMRALSSFLRCQLLLQRRNLRLHDWIQPDQRSVPTVWKRYYL